MPAKFIPAPEVQSVAEDLIDMYHRRLLSPRGELRGKEPVRIDYYFRDDEPTRNGKAILGQARKVTGFMATLGMDEEYEPPTVMLKCPTCRGKGVLDPKAAAIERCPDCLGEGEVPVEEEGGAPPFFAMIITQSFWTVATPEQRRYLVDHELCHMGAGTDKDGNVRLSIIPHDIEDFGSVVKRHGLVMEDLQRFADSIRARLQPALRFDTEDAPLESTPLPPAISDAARKFVDDIGRTDIDSVTLSAGGKSVTLTGRRGQAKSGGVDMDNPLASAAGG